ncbi:HEAT repeat domain-containing protein [Desulfogranum marinum]|uniref:HEAT repeat domain-containing protein n=1 Tax=Desulfogranum marinum TaxID=453220 RepID=UPI0029C9B12C|nr:HEAT repeat domain-containing protein [Desulfogranum marinum]
MHTQPIHATKQPQSTVSDDELQIVIADFLEMGHVDNIIALFKQEPRCHTWSGTLLADQRFAVRLGLAVLYEHLVVECPQDVHLAIPSLAEALNNEKEWVRGEAVNLLGIIGSDQAIALVRSMTDDPSFQVVEIVTDIIDTINTTPHG